MSTHFKVLALDVIFCNFSLFLNNKTEEKTVTFSLLFTNVVIFISIMIIPYKMLLDYKTLKLNNKHNQYMMKYHIKTFLGFGIVFFYIRFFVAVFWHCSEKRMKKFRLVFIFSLLMHHNISVLIWFIKTHSHKKIILLLKTTVTLQFY